MAKEIQLVASWWRVEDGKVCDSLVKRQKGSFWSDENIFYLGKGMNYIGVHIFQVGYNIHLRLIHFYCL
jgi:hypothetical protein